MRGSNGDTDKIFQVDGDQVVGVGSYHKTLPHNDYGEVIAAEFKKLVEATRGDGSGFAKVGKGTPRKPGQPTYTLTDPQCGLAADRLTHHPAGYSMPPAPHVLSVTTAAEMTELYWMATLRDVPIVSLAGDPRTATAVGELDGLFSQAVADAGDPGRLRTGIDIPGAEGNFAGFADDTIFRLGLAGDHIGPMISQFFLRPVQYGAQSIDARINPYAPDVNYLTDFDDWLKAQDSGKDDDGHGYNEANEERAGQYEGGGSPNARRYISTCATLPGS